MVMYGMEKGMSLRRYDIAVHAMRMTSYFLVMYSIICIMFFPESWKQSYELLLLPIGLYVMLLMIVLVGAGRYMGNNPQRGETMPIFLLGIPIFALLYAYNSGFGPMYDVQIVLVIISVELWLTGRYLGNYARFIRTNAEVSQGTLRQMTQTNHGMWFLWNLSVALIAGLAMILPIWGWTDPLILQLKRGLIAFLRLIFKEKAPDVMPEVQENWDPGIIVTDEPGAQEGSGVIVILQMIALVAMVALVVYAIFLLARRVTSIVPYEGDDVELLNRDGAETKELTVHHGKRRCEENGNDARIRKLFRGSVRRRYGKNVPNSVVPEKLLEDWSRRREYCELYEKARYAEENCTTEEWKQMKQLHSVYATEGRKAENVR